MSTPDVRTDGEPVPVNRDGVVTPTGAPNPTPPKWRRDFPVDWPDDQYVARRDFTRFMVLTSFAFVVGQVWIGVKNVVRARRGRPPIRKIADLSQIPVGGVLPFKYPDDHSPCLLLRPDESTLLAYDQKCSHLTCAVQPQMKEGRLRCPCHHGFFDMATGRPLAGPPRRPLPRVTLEVRRDGIYATGIEEGLA